MQSQSESQFLTSDPTNLYFMILCGLTVAKLETASFISDDDYELTNLLVHSVRSELNRLLYETSFLSSMVTSIKLDEFAQVLFSSPESLQLELNNLSYFFIELVDSRIDAHMALVTTLSNFSLALSDVLVQQTGQDMIIKYFLYDIPFAKYSVIDTIGKLNNDFGYYYTLFESLIEKVYIELLDEMKLFKLNKEAIDLNNLQSLNFKMSLLIKYCQIFMEFVGTNTVFSANLVTSEFISQKFSRFVLKLIDLFIDMKDFNKANKYFFYYEFDEGAGSDSLALKWNKFLLLNNLNRFFKLVFIDYSLMNTLPQQLSQYLQDRHWDFILCFASAIMHKLKNLDFKKAFGQRDRTTSVELLSIDFFDMLILVLNAIKIHVRNNIPGTYPKSVYTEWNAFFSKEIFDPALGLYVELAECYASLHSQLVGKQSNYLLIQSLKSCKIRLVGCLSQIVYQVPMERLLLNDLEMKLNVFDDQADESLAIHLTDKLKTVINHLTPHLKHQMKSIQMSSYKVLKNIMR